MMPVVIRCRDLKTGQEQVHSFDYSPVIIGRAKDADVRFEADHVSNFHAQIDADEVSVAFTDLDSSNGSVVNGVSRRHQRVPISSDTRIQIGAFLIEISRALPTGVIARRRVTKKEDTTGGGARQDRTNVLDFDSREALRSLPGAIRPRAAPAPASPPVVKLERLEDDASPKLEIPSMAGSAGSRAERASAVGEGKPASGVRRLSEQSNTATLLSGGGESVPRRSETADSQPRARRHRRGARVSRGGDDRPEATPNMDVRPKVTVPVVVAIGLLTGAALGLLLFRLISFH